MAKIIPMQKIDKKDIVKRIKRGDIFIYPTDTIYGLGCNALKTESVKKIRIIKQRTDKPFSIIAPSKQWVLDNFKVKKVYIDRLPGPFTYILKPKKKNIVSKQVTKFDNVGVRIPDHPFTKLIQKTNVPFITTSVNISGKDPAVDINRISPLITEQVDVIIDDGVLDNKPSTILDLTGDMAKIIRQ